MFIVLEGISGSGKSMLASRLAARLRALGYRVARAREPGEPRGGVCIAERSLHSGLALGMGQGLVEPGEEPGGGLAWAGARPDLILLLDVEPELARLRGEAARARQGEPECEPAHLALGGAGLAWRVRAMLRTLAAREPGRWLVLENEGVAPHVLEQQALAAVLHRLRGHAPEPARGERSEAGRRVALEEVEERCVSALEALEEHEPALALWLLRGVEGVAAHQRRLALVERLPGLAVRSVEGLEDGPSWALREGLAGVVPREVAASLGTSAAEEALALRERLYRRAPAEVLAGLEGQDTARAWVLRERALGQGRLVEVLGGLAGVDSEAAWAVREQGVRYGLGAEVARSLAGLGSERAEALREVLLARERLAVLESTRGLETPLACGLREELAEVAPGPVLRSLRGLESESSLALRERLAARAPEALESLAGLGPPRAWSLREAHVARWPAAVLASLEGLALSERAEALVRRALTAAPSSLTVLCQAWRLLATEGSHLTGSKLEPLPRYA